MNQTFDHLINFNPKSLPKKGPLFKGENLEEFEKP